MPKISSEIFKEYDIRGLYPAQINESVAYKLGRAFVLSLKAKKIIVGQDRRPASAKVLNSFIRGAVDESGEISGLGVCSTPELFFAVGKYNFAGGVMATASHNPSGYVGFKMVDKYGIALGGKTGLKKIKALADKLPERKISKKKAGFKYLNVGADYGRAVLSLINKDTIKKSKLVLDASGGSADKLADYVFSRLPNKLIKLNFQSKSQKAPHELNPLLISSQKSAKNAIIKNQADLGLIWDGDGDRCIFLDEKGKYIFPYYINCLMSQIILKKKSGIGIVVDARLPVGIGEVIKEAGGKPIISRSGTSNVICLMQEKKLLFGCENSGHFFFNFLFFRGLKKNFVYAEAIIPILLILEHLTENNLKLSQVIAQFSDKYFISGEINLAVDNFKAIENKLKNFYRGNKFKTIDGLSVFGPDWFFNIRPSHTEPLARLNIEARNKGVLGKMKKEILNIITK